MRCSLSADGCPTRARRVLYAQFLPGRSPGLPHAGAAGSLDPNIAKQLDGVAPRGRGGFLVAIIPGAGEVGCPTRARRVLVNLDAGQRALRLPHAGAAGSLSAACCGVRFSVAPRGRGGFQSTRWSRGRRIGCPTRARRVRGLWAGIVARNGLPHAGAAGSRPLAALRRKDQVAPRGRGGFY